jgi:hypothetical protein
MPHNESDLIMPARGWMLVSTAMLIGASALNNSAFGSNPHQARVIDFYGEEVLPRVNRSKNSGS